MKESKTHQRVSSSEYRVMRQGLNQDGAPLILSNDELQEVRKLQAGRSTRVAGEVARFEIFGTQGEIVDREYSGIGLIGRVFDAQGQPVENALILFDASVGNRTGSAFYIDGDPTPRSKSFGFSGVDGYFQAEDVLVTGTSPGALSIRVTWADDPDGKVSATYEKRVSSRIPSKAEGESGGGEEFIAGSIVGVAVAALLTDGAGVPIDYGSLRFEVNDPNDTGTVIIFGGGYIAVWVQMPLDEGGVAKLSETLRVGSRNPGSDFYLRVSRYGNEPFFDFKYSTV
jgi:hypothetical protein